MSAKFKYKKRKALLESAQKEPERVLTETLTSQMTEQFHLKLFYWLTIATDYYYEDDYERLMLHHFYTHLQRFIQALMLVYEPDGYYTDKDRDTLRPDEEQIIWEYKGKVVKLKPKQRKNPAKVITAFYKRFSIKYIRREMWCWLKAAYYFQGKMPERLSNSILIFAYEDVMCMVETAYVIFGKRK